MTSPTRPPCGEGMSSPICVPETPPGLIYQKICWRESSSRRPRGGTPSPLWWTYRSTYLLKVLRISSQFQNFHQKSRRLPPILYPKKIRNRWFCFSERILAAASEKKQHAQCHVQSSRAEQDVMWQQRWSALCAFPNLRSACPLNASSVGGGGAIRAPAVKLVLAYKMLVHPSRRFSSILLRNSPQTMWYLPNCFVIWYLFICWEALLNLPFSIQILKLIAKDGSSNDSCFLFQLARRRFEKIQCMERLQLREPTEIWPSLQQTFLTRLDFSGRPDGSEIAPNVTRTCY